MNEFPLLYVRVNIAGDAPHNELYGIMLIKHV
jgi:hypothetical protein